MEALQTSWEMSPRGLYPKMCANLFDVVARRFSKMSTLFEASLANRDKEVVS